MSVDLNIDGISVALPLVYDDEDGPYRLNKTVLEAVSQNFKNLLLTSPGERIMIPDFGVGVRNFLFEPLEGQTYSNLRNAIDTQVNRYMPFLTINDVSFIDSSNNPSVGFNEVRIIVSYTIDPLNESSTVEISERID
jgi:phage baseplate assembly protein W